MERFEFYLPNTIDEALDLINRFQDSCLIVAGGTDAVIELNEQRKKVNHVISINRITGLKGISVNNGKVSIRALTTFSDLEENDYVRTKLRSIYNMARYMGSPQIRNLATIGGNVSNASVAGDAPTLLTAFDANVVLKSKSGTRSMKLTEFNEGPDKCKLTKDELLTEVNFEEPSEDDYVSYMKIGKRKALSIVDLGLAIKISRNKKNICSSAKVIAGAISLHPVNLEKVESALLGREINSQSLMMTLPLFADKVVECISHRPWELVYKKECIIGAAEYCFAEILNYFKLN